jgi:hypothetical protein
MGRPLNKKFFGNRNIGSTSTTADNGIGGQGVASVTISGVWSGFTQETSTVTFSAPQLPGGVTATGTVTITAGAPVSVTITEKGSGYTSAPTVTIADSDVGAETSGTATAVLTVDTGAPGSATNQENAISGQAFITGGSAKVYDIVKQEASKRYLVKTADGRAQCKLVTTAPLAAGQMHIIATDANGSTYYVRKLTARRAVLVQKEESGSFAFENNSVAGWTLNSASAGIVSIANN